MLEENSPEEANLVQVLCDEEALRHNIRLLQQKGSVLYVVKANAYGHGMIYTGKILEDEGALGMIVSTVGEAVNLRKAGIKAEIFAHMGAVNYSEILRALRHEICLAVHSMNCLDNLYKAACELKKDKVSFVLKLDSGMSRLGFCKEDIPALLTSLKEKSCLRPLYVASHFAVADDCAFAEHSEKQIENFLCMFEQIVKVFPSAKVSFANSAAFVSMQERLQKALFERLGASPECYGRIGFALYGYDPFCSVSETEKGKFEVSEKKDSMYADLRSVMSVCAPILSIRTVRAGETISYGCTFTAQKDMKVAIVAIGYADGYLLASSSRAFMLLCGERAPVLGRICMQMTMIDCTHIPLAKQGDMAYVLGGSKGARESISVYELAHWAQTIPYELVCALGRKAGC